MINPATTKAIGCIVYRNNIVVSLLLVILR